MAALVTNVQEGVSDVMVIVLANISDKHFNRFRMIVFTNAAYFLGIFLLWISSGFMSAHAAARVYYLAAVLVFLGEAGRSASLKEFLEDQYFSELKQRPSTDKNYKKRVGTRLEALWHHPWFLGAFLPLFFMSNVSWPHTFMISAMLVGVSYLVFWLGYSYYFVSSKIDESTWKPRLEYLAKTAVLDRCPPLERGREICTITRIPITSSSTPLEEEQRKSFWPLIKLKPEKRFLIEVIGMCSAFFAYSLVEATGSTFFFEQMSNLDNHPGSPEVSALYFSVLKDFSSFLVSFLYDLLIPIHWRNATLVRIGCGLACSVLCSVAAWQVEDKRLVAVKNDPDTTISMSILWLVPQFALLGLMQGLALNGLITFLADRIAINDRLRARYNASHISDLVLGIGKLITGVSILMFRRSWFDSNINWSRVGNFFRALTLLSLGNLMYYVCISFYFCGNEKSRPSAPMEEALQGLNDAVENGDFEDPIPEAEGGAEFKNEPVSGGGAEFEIVDDNDDEVPLGGGAEFGSEQKREVELGEYW